MDQGDVAPGTPHRVQADGGVGRRGLGQARADGAAQRWRIDRSRRTQGERSERQGRPQARPPVGEAHQFQAGAAEVAHHAFRLRLAGDDAEGGVVGLFLAGEDADDQAGLGANPVHEHPAVPGLAHGGGGGAEHPGRTRAVQHGPEAAQRGHGRDDAFGGEPPGLGEMAAEPGQDLLVIDLPDGAAFQPVEHQAHGVGADVDHRHVTAGPLFGGGHRACLRRRSSRCSPPGEAVGAAG